jgi:hypothetical protein
MQVPSFLEKHIVLGKISKSVVRRIADEALKEQYM